MPRVRIKGRHLDVNISVKPLAQRFERLGDLRKRLIERTKDEAGVDRLLELHLSRVFGDLATRYLNHMEPTIDRIFSIRGEISPLYHAILDGTGDAQTSRRVLDLLADLEREMDNIKSPTDFANAQNKIDVPIDPIPESPLTASRKSRHETAVASLKASEKHLIEAVEARLGELQKREQKYRGNGMEWVAERIKRQKERLHKWLTDKNAELRAKVLADEVGNSPYLSELAANGGESMLLELWLRYDPRRRFLKSKNFEEYVRRNQDQVRGALGEFDAAHRISDTHDLLKGPDHDINKPGTDLIALNRESGEILVIDNKAYKGRGIDSVSALVQNIVKNLETDAKNLEKLLSEPDIPSKVKDAVRRLKDAAAELREYYEKRGITDEGKDKSKRMSEEVQLEVQKILDKHNIKRKVTNAYGEKIMNLKQELQAIGIDPYDLE